MRTKKGNSKRFTFMSRTQVGWAARLRGIPQLPQRGGSPLLHGNSRACSPRGKRWPSAASPFRSRDGHGAVYLQPPQNRRAPALFGRGKAGHRLQLAAPEEGLQQTGDRIFEHQPECASAVAYFHFLLRGNLGE